jgi:hypothetical protein
LTMASINVEHSKIIDGHFPEHLKIKIPHTQKSYPTVLEPFVPDKLIQLTLEEWQQEEDIDTSEWINSSQIGDENLLLKSLLMYYNPDEDETIHADHILACIFANYAAQKESTTVFNGLTPEEAVLIDVNDTASGVLPLDPSAGKIQGKKRTMQPGAALCVLDGTMINSSQRPKAEVLKKNKKLRRVVVQSQHHFLQNTAFGQEDCTFKEQYQRGICIGVSRNDGGFMKILYPLFKLSTYHRPEMDFPTFLDTIEKDGMQELDAKSWEFKLNRNVILSELLIRCGNVKCTTELAYDQVANVLAHSCVFFVKYNEEDAIICLWKKMSGEKATASGNSRANKNGEFMALYEIQCNGLQIGDKIVEYKDLDPYEVAKLWKMTYGDDLYGMVSRYEESFNKLRTRYIGPEFTSNTLNAFGPGCAKFLQVGFKRIGRGVVTSFREENRVFGKLCHGYARGGMAQMKSSIISACFNLGDNKEAIEKLHRLWRMLPPVDDDEMGWAMKIESASKKQLGMGFDMLSPPTYDEVMLAQTNMFTPAIVIDRAFRQFD